ncbi:uncharacterized protein V6R79_003310 [Siganus canaliculatus]
MLSVHSVLKAAASSLDVPLLDGILSLCSCIVHNGKKTSLFLSPRESPGRGDLQGTEQSGPGGVEGINNHFPLRVFRSECIKENASEESGAVYRKSSRARKSEQRDGRHSHRPSCLQGQLQRDRQHWSNVEQQLQQLQLQHSGFRRQYDAEHLQRSGATGVRMATKGNRPGQRETRPERAGHSANQSIHFVKVAERVRKDLEKEKQPLSRADYEELLPAFMFNRQEVDIEKAVQSMGRKPCPAARNNTSRSSRQRRRGKTR